MEELAAILKPVVKKLGQLGIKPCPSLLQKGLTDYVISYKNGKDLHNMFWVSINGDELSFSRQYARIDFIDKFIYRLSDEHFSIDKIAADLFTEYSSFLEDLARIKPATFEESWHMPTLSADATRREEQKRRAKQFSYRKKTYNKAMANDFRRKFGV